MAIQCEGNQPNTLNSRAFLVRLLCAAGSCYKLYVSFTLWFVDCEVVLPSRNRENEMVAV